MRSAVDPKSTGSTGWPLRVPVLQRGAPTAPRPGRGSRNATGVTFCSRKVRILRTLAAMRSSAVSNALWSHPVESAPCRVVEGLVGRILDVAVETLVGVAQGGVGGVPLIAAVEELLIEFGTRLGRDGHALLGARRRWVSLDVGLQLHAPRPAVLGCQGGRLEVTADEGPRVGRGHERRTWPSGSGLPLRASEVAPAFREAGLIGGLINRGLPGSRWWRQRGALGWKGSTRPLQSGGNPGTSVMTPS